MSSRSRTSPEPDGGTGKITGYQINNQVNVTVRKIDDLGKILDAAVAAGANSIYGVSFSVDDPTPYRTASPRGGCQGRTGQSGTTRQSRRTDARQDRVDQRGNRFAPTDIPRGGCPKAWGGSSVPVETGEMDVTVSVDVRFAVQ